MKVSIIILTCNQCRTTLECLASLGQLPDDIEIILVDNGSSDSTISEVSRLYPRVIIVPLQENIGVARGRNAGILHARGRYIMLLDNDTLPTAGAVMSLAAYLDAHPTCALVAPRLVDSAGHTQRSFRPFPGITEKISSLLRLTPDIVPPDTIPDAPFSPFYVIGAAQLIRRSVFDQIGLLDENIFYGPEDADLCTRIRRSGLGEIIFLPSVVIVHHWQRASRSPFSPLWRRHLVSLLHFYRKHRRLC
ncbi:MAG: glycosyltransferase family 2 protein [Muribaculaceae bacterium]|nr:glycosyltransferase family 2 protein [Muribaculaceae bacterium]